MMFRKKFLFGVSDNDKQKTIYRLFYFTAKKDNREKHFRNFFFFFL